jgi:hypothetical protein
MRLRVEKLTESAPERGCPAVSVAAVPIEYE